ncbi:MAG: hypothetical protein JST11_22540 [Acidobacteria bacterium]|nr:hypothetical protein [Acidobacteriota bacterium]
MTCSTNVTVTPTLRGEGFTEQTGDITLVCTGGPIMQVGAVVPTVNIQISLNTAITSRLLPISNVSGATSEALLLIDEPGSGLTSATGSGNTFGPNAPINICPYPTNPLGVSSVPSSSNCLEYVSSLVAGPNAPNPGAVVLVSTNTAQGTTATTPGYNGFQGVVSGNTVTFFGVPVLPPVTAGYSRVFRVTNIRANATTLSGASASGPAQVVASISITGATSLLINNPTPIVGFVQNGLTASASSMKNLNQCSSYTRYAVNTLTYSELFPTAFKTRVAAASTASYSGQINNPVQNIPGQIYYSESNFVQTVPNGLVAGLANYGTRLQAAFSGIPTGVRLFVSTNNVLNDALGFSVIGGNPGGSAGNVGTTSYVQLVTSSTVDDGNASGGFFPAFTSTDSASTGGTPITEIPVAADGTASAVWEVMNTNPNALDSFKVSVYTTYTSNVAQNLPATNTSPAVTMSFAPVYSGGSAAAASSSLPIPRFSPGSIAQANIFKINICRTILLYPYITNQAGYDTGVAISNTSMDPFGTGNQAGTCGLNWYQGTNNPAVTTTPVIAAGTTWANLASILVPGFGSGGPSGAGYMIAVCNFQYAHGFAVVQDLGGRNFGMSYLALVVPDPAANSGRAASDLSKSAGGSGENIAH